jgi:hypothetical protein
MTCEAAGGKEICSKLGDCTCNLGGCGENKISDGAGGCVCDPNILCTDKGGSKGKNPDTCECEYELISACELYSNGRFAGLDESNFMLETDTCNGDNENPFTCSGSAKTCTDVYYNAEATSKSGSYNQSQKINELGLVPLDEPCDRYDWYEEDPFHKICKPPSGLEEMETCSYGDIFSTFSCDRKYDEGATYYTLAAEFGGVFKCIDIYQPEGHAFIEQFYKREVECIVKKSYTARDVVCGDKASCK